MNKKCSLCNGKKTVDNPEYAKALAKEIEYHEDKAPSYAIAERWAEKSVDEPKTITCPKCKGSGKED